MEFLFIRPSLKIMRFLNKKSSRIILLLSMLLVTLQLPLQIVEASPEKIYIKPDGSIDPSTAPILSIDNTTYIFTDNIYDEIVVERSNIIINGNQYMVQGNGNGTGVFLSGINNVTIININIMNFAFGIYLNHSFFNSINENNITNNNEYDIYLDTSSNVSISGNSITDSYRGINLRESSNNSISGNMILNNEYGVYFSGSSKSKIFGNHITNHHYSITFDGSSNVSISGNSITDSYGGIYLRESSNNSISGNMILNNEFHGVEIHSSSQNSLSENNITNNYRGIALYGSSYTNVSKNNVSENNETAVFIQESSNNSISGNMILNNEYAIVSYGSLKSSIFENIIINNDYGIFSRESSNNSIYHNNFINNVVQANDVAPTDNHWHHPDVLEGNYWSDYPGFDDGSGEGKHSIVGDDIGDTHIPWPGTNYDYYPYVDSTEPIAEAGPDQNVDEDSLVILNGYGSSDNIYIVSYVWTFADKTQKTLIGVNPTYNFTDPGTYLLTLNVTDAAGNYATDDVIITVTDVTPPFVDAGSDKTINVNTLVSFNASGSSDNVGIVSYEWDFGDGNTGTGEITTYIYRKTGTYLVMLTAGDEADNEATDTLIITVEEIKIMVDETIYTVPIDTNSTILDHVFNPINLQINLTVISPVGTIGAINITIPKEIKPEGYDLQVYLDGESHTFTLTKNATYYFVYLNFIHSQHQITIIFIDLIDPIAEAGIDKTVDVNTLVSFNASGSSDNVGIVSYEWDFGDGNTGTGLITAHAYIEAGIYTATLTVRDATGNADTDTLTITVKAFIPWWILGVVLITCSAVTLMVYFSRLRKSS